MADAERGERFHFKPGPVRAYRTMPCGHPVRVEDPDPDICAFCYDHEEARLLHALQAVHGRGERAPRLCTSTSERAATI